MSRPRCPTDSHLWAAALGAIAGGITVAIATRAIPGMLSRVMSGMMVNTMMRMGGEDCDPEEM